MIVFLIGFMVGVMAAAIACYLIACYVLPG